MSAAAAPEWFTNAIEAPTESHYVNVAGVPIHYLSWNAHATDKPGLLFAHGFRAHARWWSLIAPFFLSRFRVVALDFAGMGDSGTREQYDSELFSQDMLGVIEHARLGKATLVGHSFGGGRVLRACADHPQHIERAVILDSFLRLPDMEQPAPPPQQKPRAKRIYPTYDAARARFRLVPAQNRAEPYVLDYLGHHSLRQVEGGWTWKFDGDFASRRSTEHNSNWAAEALAQAEMPITFVYGDSSAIVSHELAHAIVSRLRHGRGPIAIPQSHHHVMLDQPLSLVAALRGILY